MDIINLKLNITTESAIANRGHYRKIKVNEHQYYYSYSEIGAVHNMADRDVYEITEKSNIIVQLDRTLRGRFIITGGGMRGTIENDLSFSFSDKGDDKIDNQKLIIHDTNEHELFAEVIVYVYDKELDCDIPCDPSIRNRPSRVQ